MNRIAGALIVSACVGACAVQRAQVSSEAKERMIGLSRERVLACMGPPAQRMTEGATEVWAYQSGDGTVVSSGFGSATTNASVTATGNSATGQAQTFGSSVGVSRRRFCQINVVMSGGIVAAVNYQGPTGGLLTQGEQCAFAVQSCVQ